MCASDKTRTEDADMRAEEEELKEQSIVTADCLTQDFVAVARMGRADRFCFDEEVR